MKVDSSLCVKCKGVRLLCGRPTCPILARFRHAKSISAIGKELCGASPPEVLVGSRFWPKVFVGPLLSTASPEEAQLFGDPEHLFGKSIEEVIGLRSRLVRSVLRVDVRRTAHAGNRLLEAVREVGLSQVGIEAEAKFSKPPKPVLRFDGILAPAGPSGRVEELRVVGNPKVPRVVERLVGDTNAKALDAVWELYKRGVSVYYISRLLSIGLLGKMRRRVLVPSRWAITATDSMVSRWLANRLRDFPELSEVWLYISEYAGNHYVVLLAPSPLSFELVEIWLPRSVWTAEAAQAFIESDCEDWRGKTLFSQLGGGYYAVKLPVYEFLYSIKRQAFAFAIREVTPNYWAPLGSWKIREALRRAFSLPPKKFSTVEEALREVAKAIDTPFDQWFPKARMLRRFLTQKRLDEFSAAE